MGAGMQVGPGTDPLYGPGPRPVDPTDYKAMGYSRPLPPGYEWDPITQSIGRTPSAAGGRAGQALTGLEQAAPDFFSGLKAFGQYTSGAGGGGPFAKVQFPHPGAQGPPFPGVGVGGGPAAITSGGQGASPFGQTTALPGQDNSTNPALAGLLKSLGGR